MTVPYLTAMHDDETKRNPTGVDRNSSTLRHTSAKLITAGPLSAVTDSALCLPSRSFGRWRGDGSLRVACVTPLSPLGEGGLAPAP